MELSSHLRWKSREAAYEIVHDPLKRIFDLLFSLSFLILASPFFLILSLLVALSSPGPVFYAHERLGRGGKKIRCWKFRTMHKNADKILLKMLQKNPVLQAEWNQYYKLKNDPRITPIGHFLRKTSLDELPQFFNVVKGEMSVVGPRPCVEKELFENYKDKSALILSIRPGITGIWQTSGRNNLTREERVKIEELYIKERTLLLDLKLILKTIPMVLFSKGAY
jgi:undecaprenyl-phosphate galactose phosphotransferase